MFTTILAFAGAASAAAIMPRAASDDKCCFGINVSGGVSNGGLGQFTDGQNRVGPGYGGSQYCYYAASQSIVDASGRGCVISAPTNQYQCDAGVTAATAATGITIAANSSIEHNGNAVWYECYSTAAEGVYNIYATNPGSAALDCHPITLTTTGSNCNVAPASSSSAIASSSKSSSASTASVKTSTVATTVATTVKASTVPAPVSSSSAPAPPPPASTPQASSSASAPPPPPPATTPKPASSSPPAAPPASTPVAPPPAASVSSCVPVTVTLPASTVTVTVMPSCPAAPACTPVAPSSPAAPTTAAPSSPATTYACNPAHSYPNGAMCVSSGTGLTLVTPVPSTPAAPTTAAPSSPVTTYACNPAHSYPNGAMCVSSGTGLTLVTPVPSTPAAPTTAVASTTIVTSTVARTSTAVVSSATAPAASGSAAPPAPAASSCPVGIVGQKYQYPHLIVPVNKDSPNTAYGTQYSGSVNGSFSTIFNFDIPASYASSTCSLEFLLPNKKDLVTSDYTFSGTGMIDFEMLASPATQSTTYANQPKVAKDLGSFSITPGSSTIIASGPCAAGQTVSYELVAKDTTALHYFQDYNPSALGLYIVSC